MKVIVKDRIIDTSLISDIQVWGSPELFNENIYEPEEIGVFIMYYEDRFTGDKNDLIVLGFVCEDVYRNKELLNECERIVEFIESHRTKPDYPEFK